MSDRAVFYFLVFYVVGAIISFGPATVESENAEYLHEATCSPQPSCRAFGPSASTGVFKAAFWPMWLSYSIAKKAEQQD